MVMTEEAQMSTTSTRYVYRFGGGVNDGGKGDKNLLGGKGANLDGMAAIGLPVPPGFTITTEVCTHYYANNETYPADLDAQVQAALAKVEGVVGKTFGDVFDVHARVIDERGLTRHRLNSCGYSLGARFSPSWMEHQMFHAGNPQEIAADMTLFVHMIIMDSETGTAMTLGQTYITTEGAPKPLSRYGLDFITA